MNFRIQLFQKQNFGKKFYFIFFSSSYIHLKKDEIILFVHVIWLHFIAYIAQQAYLYLIKN